MKTKFYLLALSAAVLAGNVSTGSGQVFDSVEALNNRAIAASPRAKEIFPWLTRSAEGTVTKRVAADRTTHRCIAASPRMMEQFPELARPAQAVSTTGAFSSTVLKNRAVAASPRAKEEYPWLARDKFTVTEEPFQIAPLK